MYIVFGIILFGILITVHELGHFIAAKSCGIKVNEFAIGMGPKLLKKQGKETLYSLRLLPIGGFCEMEGEDGGSEDSRSFSEKPLWKRFIVLVSGSVMNFLTGLLIVAILLAGTKEFVSTTIDSFPVGFPNEGVEGFMVEDIVYKVNGHRIYTTGDFSTYMEQSGGEAVDIVVIRDGEKLTLSGVSLSPRVYEEGKAARYGINFRREEATPGLKLKNMWYTTVNFIRMVWMSLTALVTGAVGISNLMGPVGIVSVINNVGQEANSVWAAISGIAYLGAFIAVNLAMMNLLPIPALDGGRIFFMYITRLIEKITKRKLNPKYEGYIHAATMFLLLGLMAFVMFNDIVGIVNG